MIDVSEPELLQSLRQPETRRTAFDQLIRCYQECVYGVIRKMVIDHDDTDDLVQEVFIKVWKNIDQFKGESGLFTWIYRIAANEALQFLRKRKRRMIFSGGYEEVMNQQVAGQAGLDGDEIQQKLQKAILKLPDKQRLIFNFRYFEELKYEEIAAITGKSVGNLKAGYHHAVKKIEKFLNEN